MYEINLYPPVVTQSYMPAFVPNEGCKVYFELSSLNSIQELYHYSSSNGDIIYKAAQVSIRKQRDNQNALKSGSNGFVREIMLKPILQDEEDAIQGNNRYYILIQDDNIQNLTNYQYYKVQIRFVESFSSQELSDDFDKSSSFGTWLDQNLEHFSEWSSVILIKRIVKPTLTIKINGSTNSPSVTLSNDFVQVTGILQERRNYTLYPSTEKLEVCRVRIYKESTLIQDSGEIYAKDNAFSYIVKSVLANQGAYHFTFSYVTENLYTEDDLYRDVTVNFSGGAAAGTLQLQDTINNDIGYITLRMTRNLTSGSSADKQLYYSYDAADHALKVSTSVGSFDSESVILDKKTIQYILSDKLITCSSLFLDGIIASSERLVIRRTSSKTNFTVWEKIDEISIIDDDIVEMCWYDYTAEPGVWYKYQVIRYDTNNNKTELKTDAATPIMLDTEDIFLSAEGKELIIRFNPNIGNMTIKTAESITDTLGSQYPFFRRNGNVKYKTFSLSGTITCFMNTDFNEFQGSPKDVYGSTRLSSLGYKRNQKGQSLGYYKSVADLYEEYNTKNNINQYNDSIYEKFFRDQVQEFLQSSTVKLFRSLTEGNMLVKLNNISFTPNQTLGRHIYDFSCTAYEVAQCNEYNYSKYNIVQNNVKFVHKGGAIT